MKCFYHKADLDGHCAGAIVRKFNPECEMIGVDYDDSLDTTIIDLKTESEKIFIVDFSFSKAEMEWLFVHAHPVWIDHHKSSIEKMVKLGPYISGIRKAGSAGCELAWKYFSSDPMPLAVHLLGRYDVWDHEDERVLPFQYGMRLYDNTCPEQPLWDDYLKYAELNAMVDSVIKHGRTILKYQEDQNAMYAKGMSYEAEFEGCSAIVLNKAFANSKAFDAVYDPKKHDIMILFGVKPGKIKYTLFSDKPEIDVSEIAKRFNGGGHANAAGFYSETLVV